MITYGIALNNNGGEIIQIKTTTKQGNGILKITGSVSKDIINSVKNALHSLKAPSNIDINIDIKGGSFPLSGPSLGFAISKSLAGAINNLSDKGYIYTGTIDSKGKIGPVGGLTIKHETAKKYNKVLQTNL